MNNLLLILVVAVVAVGIVVFVRSQAAEDFWRMENGTWVKHGHPAMGPEGSSTVLYYPLAGEVVSSPLVLEGEALGTWYFEGSFPIELHGDDGIIAQTVAQAKGDWMTEEFVPFEATLVFDKPDTETGAMLFRKDNPSGDPEKDAVEVFSVRF